MSASRQYELVYLITPDASEQEVADLHTQIDQIVSRFGASNTVLDKTENWGRRKLAYTVHRNKTGNVSLRSRLRGSRVADEFRGSSVGVRVARVGLG